ncbi:cation:proton antiporter subunit C [candidate division WOR-3 bacterium]|nr:cation:proton antiporter subunit C [candidate division WOR-3 bacterium]
MIANLPFLVAIVLVIIGLATVVFKRNLIKIVIGIGVIENGVNLFLITLGYRENSIAPIYTASPGGIMSYPVPQALTLTSIVIGVAVIALMLSLIIHIYRHNKTLDVWKLGRRET